MKYSFILASSIGLAAAQQTCNSSVEVKSQSDADELASCETFTGDINISGEAGILILNGIRHIEGSLFAKNATHLSALNAPQLVNITDTFELTSLLSLVTLSFPELDKVGKIQFQTLPQLRELQFNRGVSECKDVLISDTQLSTLKGLNLSTVDTLNVNNNFQINEINVSAKTISNLLDISFNSNNVHVSFPDLEVCNNATFRFCNSVALPSLKHVNQSLGFINNTVTNITLGKLESVGESLAIVSNQVTSLNFPKLEKIGGGFIIANNTQLRNAKGFDELERVDGTIDFTGNFTSASLPKLNDVQGGIKIKSTNPINCTAFDNLHKKGAVRGNTYECEGLADPDELSSTLHSQTSSRSASRTASEHSKTKKGSKSSSDIAVVLPISGAVFALAMYFL